METLSKIVVAIIAVVALGVGVVAYNRPDVLPPFGAASGTDHFNRESFETIPTFGDTCYATSTTAAVGTLPNLGDGISCVDYTVNQADVTLTLMASTSSWLPQRVNASRTLRIRNATSTATADIILAAGTGINIKTASSTAGKLTIFGDTSRDNAAVINFTRLTNGDVAAEVLLFED